MPLPPGHTPFSWTGELVAGSVPPGHTLFSLNGGVYVEGSAPSMKDVFVFKAICPVPTLPHAARWYRHIAPVVAKMHEVDRLSARLCTLPGVYENLIPGAGSASGKAEAQGPAPATAPARAAKADPGVEAENSATQQEVLALLLQKIPNKFKTSGYKLARPTLAVSVRASSPAVSAAGDFKFT